MIRQTAQKTQFKMLARRCISTLAASFLGASFAAAETNLPEMTCAQKVKSAEFSGVRYLLYFEEGPNQRYSCGSTMMGCVERSREAQEFAQQSLRFREAYEKHFDEWHDSKEDAYILERPTQREVQKMYDAADACLAELEQ